MKLNYSFVLLLLLLFGLNCADSGDADLQKQDVQILIENYTQSFQQKDFESFSNYCHENFRFFTLDGQILNKKSIIAFLNGIMSHWENVQVNIGNLEIITGTDMAFARYGLIYNFSVSGNPGSFSSLITVVFKKHQNNWQLLHYHMSRGYK